MNRHQWQCVQVPPDSTLDSFSQANQSLQTLNSNLKLCIDSLETYTRNVPRIQKVLSNAQFFELVSVSEIRAAQYQLSSELEPHLKELLNHAESGLIRLQKREQIIRTSLSKKKRATQSDEEDQDDENNEKKEVEKEDELNHKFERLESTGEQVKAQKQSLCDEIAFLDRELSKKRIVYQTLTKNSV
ncbi:hypothetical protein O181_020670 [Austropuccinia psidii MF-1]|uniref:DASH complex subunit SPC19 n=1 Tax=Austropuccinia psidii MF-1 TaxID=1389203 RepID=A0A9Q3GWB7_9BASI|nr:hypothetical protein [Austropuccinia psidii MF-1]